jgi:Icc protein
MNAPEKTLRILQITDTHLYAAEDGELLGLNTRHCLQEVVELALQSPPPDLVVASGDLSHDASPQAYRQVRDCFSRINAPVFCLPGNHDESLALRENMNGSCFHTAHTRHIGGWQMVFLDSTVAGSEGGHLAKCELDSLDTALGDNAGLPALVWLHHQPVDVGSQWLDTMAVDNPEAFFEVVDRHPNVRAIIWGHVHQDFDRQRNGVRLLATPSTCIQFLPGSDEFSIDPIPPGYRWLELYADGSFDTAVERLPQIPGEIDLSANGY